MLTLVDLYFIHRILLHFESNETHQELAVFQFYDSSKTGIKNTSDGQNNWEFSLPIVWSEEDVWPEISDLPHVFF